MNINAASIRKLISGRRDQDMSKAEFNPYRDWKIMLSLFFALLIAVAAFDAYVYFTVEDDSPTEASAPVPIETLDRRRLEEALALFQAKEAAWNALSGTSTERARVSDPSR